MLNERKIRWMAQASIYQKNEGVQDLKENAFFASDFVRYNLLKTLLGVTVAYILILGIYAVCNMEQILSMAADFQLSDLFQQALRYYIILLIIYSLVSAVIYAWRYHKSHERVRTYYRMLKLIEKYGQEDRK
jgi:hypothetical protein